MTYKLIKGTSLFQIFNIFLVELNNKTNLMVSINIYSGFINQTDMIVI
jgi:hypothetical protein